MRLRLARSIVAALALLVGAPSAAHAEAPAGVSVERPKESPFTYRVSMQKPERHEFHVEIGVTEVPGNSIDLQIPRWVPGAYNRTDAHRNVRGVVAKAGGKALPVEKIDAITWRVHHGGQPFKLSYRVYRGKYDGVTGAYLDDATGFFNGAQILMYVVGHKSRAVELRVDPLPGTTVVTGLKRGGGQNSFKADDYDVLIDAPVHVGKVEIIRFDVAKIPFRIAIAGDGSYSQKRLVEDFSRMIEATFAVFGGPPDAAGFDDYTFIVHLGQGKRGGLEHLNSTVMGTDPHVFSDPAKYARFLGLAAHEFFHSWNVKRIRPAVLGPFAYDREVHTGMLWFSEGVTSYYAWLVLARAGLVNETDTLARLAEVIQRLQETPARKLITVEQASWETWNKPDDGANAYVDYYTKGMLIGMVLDLELRRVTAGRASMDTIFRELWKRFRESGKGIYPSELEELFIRQAGVGGDEPLKKVYGAYVHGLDEIDFSKHLEAAGYALTINIDESTGDLGAVLRSEGSDVVIDRIEPEGPGDKGGLAIGDKIVAIDGDAGDLGFMRAKIRAMAGGSSHVVTVIRAGRLLERKVNAGKGGEKTYTIASVPSPTLEQLALRSAWLGLKSAPAAPGAAPGATPGAPPASLTPGAGGGIMLQPAG
ncbi:MAG: M61 family metallopeptidase [Myxococcales bacterium]|nr:M61 family metallopeptidase [Myxococcales bacterium]